MDEISIIKSDALLWKDFMLGNNDAYKVIYNSYVQPLFRYGCHFTHDRDLVKDCIQDVFIDLQNYRKGLAPTDNIRLYLFKSLKYKIVNTLIRVKRFSGNNQEEPSFLYTVSFEDEIVANETENQLRERLRRAFSKLSHRQKEALYLKFVSELSYAEIGKMLHVNYQSARNLIFRSLEKLRESHRNILVVLFLKIVNLLGNEESEQIIENFL